MRIVALGQAAVGQRLAVAIHDRVGRMLLAPGTVLTPALLQRLQERGYRSVALSDPFAPDAVPAEPVRAELRAEATEAVALCMDRARLQGHAALSPAVRMVIDAVLDAIMRNGEIAFCCQALRSLENGLFVHSVNVCVYSIMLSEALALDPVDKRHLGLGALLHDIGKIFHMDLVRKPGKLTAEEFEQIKAHTTDGFEVLRRHFELDLRAAHIALQHHERMDGSGYPRALMGDDIHPWGRVAAVADIYDTATGDRPYGAGRASHLVLGELREMADRHLLDGRFVRYLCEHVAAYPEGTVLRLRSDEYAVVVAQSDLGAASPWARVIADCRLQLVKAPETRLLDGKAPERAVDRVLPDYPRELLESVRAAGVDAQRPDVAAMRDMA